MSLNRRRRRLPTLRPGRLDVAPEVKFGERPAGVSTTARAVLAARTAVDVRRA